MGLHCVVVYCCINVYTIEEIYIFFCSVDSNGHSYPHVPSIVCNKIYLLLEQITDLNLA